MIQDIYSMRDKLSGWTPGIPFANEEIAKRWFKEQTIYSTTVKSSPEDFELYKIGQFNTDTGEIVGLQPNQFEMIVRGEDYEL